MLVHAWCEEFMMMENARVQSQNEACAFRQEEKVVIKV